MLDPLRYERQRAHNEPKGAHGAGFLLGWLLLVASIGVAFGLLRNLYSDTVAVGRLAMAKACAELDPPCRAEMRHWERSGTGQTFKIHTPSGLIVVRCRREFFLAGEFRCVLRDPAP